MKAGDLVRVIHDIPKHRDVAVILEQSSGGANVKCLWYNGNINWCPKRRLEVISENK